VIYRLTKYGRTINALLIGLERQARQISLPEVLPSSAANSPGVRNPP
jgi:hypothetical protein